MGQKRNELYALDPGTHIMDSYGHIVDKETGESRHVDEEIGALYRGLLYVKDEKKRILIHIDPLNISVASPISYQNDSKRRVEEGVGIYVTTRSPINTMDLLNEAYENIKNYKGKGAHQEDLVFGEFVVMETILDKIKALPVYEELTNAVSNSFPDKKSFMANCEDLSVIDYLLNENVPQKIYIKNN